MKKFLLAMVLGFFFTPSFTYARKLTVTSTITDCPSVRGTYTLVTFSDGSLGLFYDDGTYEVYSKKGKLKESGFYDM